MKRWRRWLLERAYRKLQLRELRAPLTDAIRLRTEFVSDTTHKLDVIWKSQGILRRDRKRIKRRMINWGRPA